jgi:sarcosine oxidase subunit gamma
MSEPAKTVVASETVTAPVTPLGGALFAGFAEIGEIGPLGMIALRAKPEIAGLAAAVEAATGCGLPAQRRIVRQGHRAACWMGPDEYLLILPRAEVATALAAISAALAGQHHLAADVSDMRAVFAIEGERAAEVLMKISPADLSALAPDELRRSRAGQVASAFWAEGQGYRLICFRSVADYMFKLLSHSAQKGSELGL